MFLGIDIGTSGVKTVLVDDGQRCIELASLAGQFDGPHSITVDQEGNLYLAEVFNGRVQKFRPKKGADPTKVVGQELRYRAPGTAQ